MRAQRVFAMSLPPPPLNPSYTYVASGWDGVASTNESQFVKEALVSGVRVDGRLPLESRELRVTLDPLAPGRVECALGATRVLAAATAELRAPFPDRPSEGVVRLSVELGPVADPSFQAGPPSEAAVEIGRIIEKGWREARAVDAEGLCVAAGKKVWHVRVDVRALDNDGNLMDCCGAAALCALLTLRRNEVSVSGDDVTVHPLDEREPVPVALHHLPLPATLAFVDEGTMMVVDPTALEESVSDGNLTVTLNAHEEVCNVHKVGRPPLAPEHLPRGMAQGVGIVKARLESIRVALDGWNAVRQRMARAGVLYTPDEGRRRAALEAQDARMQQDDARRIQALGDELMA